VNFFKGLTNRISIAMFGLLALVIIVGWISFTSIRSIGRSANEELTSLAQETSSTC
jgi:hypothetical protein